MSEVITEQDAAARKEQDAAAREETLVAGQGQWFYVFFFDGNAAATYLNTPPAQGPGEAMTTVTDEGRVHVFAYLPL